MMFVIVPNQHISFRDSWFGALLAAVAIQAYLQLFPFYATHFLGGYTGTVGFAIIFIFFFYYFGVILLAGAEINAFYAQGKRALPDNLAVMVHDVTHGLPKGEEEVQESKVRRVVLHTCWWVGAHDEACNFVCKASTRRWMDCRSRSIKEPAWLSSWMRLT